MSQSIEAVRRMIRAYNTGRTGDVHALFDPEHLNRATIEHEFGKGPEAFAMAVAWPRMTFPEDARRASGGRRVEERGDWVRASPALCGRRIGPLAGFAPTGRRFTVERIPSLRVVDGKVRDHRDWPEYRSTCRRLGEP
ncbi:ester cyclase [Streptomyces sp. HNM0645]|uniref:ester cyclase n=1 Tax=Streptomyces sp. HNM0645 TaxID=2782343 RepID=UPI0024B6EBFE|nr:ester cyclase [Streptomyces sp. HNM0645]MDI9888106.1 ester cyclase [Streptomyces sp. HNM0645]